MASAVGDPRWKDSPEYALLSNLDTFSGKLSIKDFLSGSPKQSGELKGLSDEYPSRRTTTRSAISPPR